VQSRQADVVEAARVDGASACDTFRYRESPGREPAVSGAGSC
jgi:hypothetical protein